ncbi:MAG TPA: TonB-dependent receptor plug domain-containing protein [Lacunisphaera sp.]|nr:TonB-dependent receptor plug domain-containing protein [Lacunisphaera sp.]
MRLNLLRLYLLLCWMLVSAALARADDAAIEFNLPAQPAPDALLALSKQAGVEVLFPFGELAAMRSQPVVGRYPVDTAIARLLHGTGFAPRRSGTKRFVVTAIAVPTGELRGRLLLPDGKRAAGIAVRIAGSNLATTTDPDGEFSFPNVPAGAWRVLVTADGFRPLQLTGVEVEAHRTVTLAPQWLRPAGEITVLEPYIVRAESSALRTARDAALVPRRAAGNLDLPRTEDDALPYAVYTREQIARSGVVDLNQFLQRELLDSDTAASPPERSASAGLFVTGSDFLRLRGFETDETVIFVNGRRLPETLQATTGRLGAPDVNVIPLGLIQQVEVLPVSASALYGGNAVGGVINIVLRPDVDATELSTTYTNTLGGYDAPESTVSLLHGRSLLGGRLRFRLNLTSARSLPPTDRELGFLAARSDPAEAGSAGLFRATPNVRSADGGPLFGPGTSSFTSVAPGADGTGGLSAFASRQGVSSLGLFDGPGGMASSPASVDYAYGRRQRRDTLFASVAGDPWPWLELGLDVAHSRATMTRGYGVFSQELTLRGSSPLNPFGRDVLVSLNDTPAALGPDYNEAQLRMTSAVVGALLKFPGDWRANFDAQYSRSIARFRGVIATDAGRWQQLVDTGVYNPLRDTQLQAPPAAFYDDALVFQGARGEFATLSDYDTLDAAVRVTNQSLELPTGRGAVNFGGDYRRNHLAPFTDVRRYGDGSVAGTPMAWSGRTLARYSAFGELQAPVLPASRRPTWLTGLDADLALRGIASNNANEAYLAPTLALKAEFAHGFSLRGSFTTSNRFPTPHMSEPIFASGGTGAGGGEGVTIYDPLRDERYVVNASQPLTPGLRAESAATQTLGVIYQHGRENRVRIALDYVDTRKTNELFSLDAQGAVNLEAFFPAQVRRDAGGRITDVYTGNVNAAMRRSQNWNLAVDYSRQKILGGTLECYGRWVFFQRYDRQLLPASPVVDELGHPDGSATGLLRHRLNFGANWIGRAFGGGIDGHYFGARILPEIEWPSQGSDRVAASTQFDVFLQATFRAVKAWSHLRELRVQVRVNNVFDAAFPRYANDPSGAGVQPYGDWRGRRFSLSLATAF